ncbi:MAG: hypothetical protein IPM42_05305 [Saprospiraceae bacterium]|nr:hypothetical protein [Saprospiraceae bacterium]
MKRNWIIAGLLIIIIGSVVGYKLYNKPHKNIEKSSADFTLTPEELLAAYEMNEDEANLIYLDKVIQISGKVKEIMNTGQTSSLMLDTGNEMAGIICEFQDVASLSDINVGGEVTVKGICSGKLMDIVLVRSVLIKNNQ